MTTFPIPSLADLVARARAAFASQLPGSDATLPGNNITPTAKVLGGEMWPLFGKLGWALRQAFVLYAEDKYLDWHGSQYGVARKPAALATGAVLVTVSTGTVTLAAGAVLARGNGDTRYAVDVAQTFATPGVYSVAVTAQAPGDLANSVAGTALAPLSGVAWTAAAPLFVVDSAGVVGGADVERDEPYRQRVLFRLRFPPHGGSAPDYVRWGMEVAGVTRVYVERLWAGSGTVRIFPFFDDRRVGGIPTSGELQAVRDHLAPLIPASAGLTVAGAAAQPIDVTIANFQPATAEAQEAARQAMRDVIRDRGQPAGSDAGAATMPFLATPFVFSRSWLSEAVAGATGETRHRIDSPAGDVTIATGSAPVLGAVTFL